MGVPSEVVNVIDAMHLTDSESYQRTFEPDQAGRLQPGYYLVLWKDEIEVSRFDAQADYVGPFPTRRVAEDVLAFFCR